MSRLLFCLIGFLFFSMESYSQKAETPRLNFGVEQDILPYATGGYFAGFWAGKNHVRIRTLMARVHKPDFIVKDGFTNNRVTAYAVLGDYFLKQNWQGWWIGSGLVYWKSSIQAKEKISIANFNNLLLNGSLGYNWKLFKNFYVCPWAGMHLRVDGDKKVIVDGQIFEPPLFNPEASVKLGVYF